MATEVKHRRLRWLELGLRMKLERIPKKGLNWNPPGKRKQGRPKITLRKTFERDFKKMELTWGTTISKKENFMEKGVAASLMDRGEERRRRSCSSIFEYSKYLGLNPAPSWNTDTYLLAHTHRQYMQ